MGEQQYISELKSKLVEETHEFVDAKSKDDMLKELSDVQEVVDATLSEIGKSRQDLIDIQRKRREKNG